MRRSPHDCYKVLLILGRSRQVAAHVTFGHNLCNVDYCLALQSLQYRLLFGRLCLLSKALLVKRPCPRYCKHLAHWCAVVPFLPLENPTFVQLLQIRVGFLPFVFIPCICSASKLLSGCLAFFCLHGGA